MQNVDFIGIDSVALCIKQSKLTKFIISRPGAGKGSIPVFECIDNSQNSKAVDAFKEWGEMSLRMNALNCIAYEILLYSTGSAYDEESVSEAEGRSKQKSNKIKFTFSLTAPQGYGGSYGGSGSGNLKDELRTMFSEFKRDMEVDNLRAENLRLKAQLEEEDDDDEEDHIGKVTQLLQLVQAGKFKKMPAKISGEDEIPEEHEEVNQTATLDPLKEKRIQLNKDLKVLSKSGFKFSDITKLADLSVKNPSLFKTILANLRTM